MAFNGGPGARRANACLTLILRIPACLSSPSKSCQDRWGGAGIDERLSFSSWPALVSADPIGSQPWEASSRSDCGADCGRRAGHLPLLPIDYVMAIVIDQSKHLENCCVFHDNVRTWPSYGPFDRPSAPAIENPSIGQARRRKTTSSAAEPIMRAASTSYRLMASPAVRPATRPVLIRCSTSAKSGGSSG